jgi:signal transduction histidine kinase
MERRPNFINQHLVVFFAVIAAVALAFSAGLSLYLSNAFVKKEIIKSTELSNHALTTVFVNEIYPELKGLLNLEVVAGAKKDNILDPQSFGRTNKRVLQFIKDTGVLKVKIFNSDGITVYSTDQGDIGKDYSSRPAFVAAMNGTLTSEYSSRKDYKAIGKTYEHVDVVSSYVPIKLASGEIIGVAELYIDRTRSIERANVITKKLVFTLPAISMVVFLLLLSIVWYAENQRKAQNAVLDKKNKELEAAREKAYQASKAKSEFLAIMSHEIRTPLNGVIATLSLIERAGLTKETADLIDTAMHSSELLTSVINDILDYSKIEANKLELKVRSVYLEDLFLQVANNYRSLIEDKGLEFHVDVSGIAGLYVATDPVRVKQILNNYLNNAYKFTTQGFVGISAARLDDGRIRFSVSDSGIGIEEQDQGRLFQDFSQLDTGTKRNFGGTGLGLSICKKLATLMDGEVDVVSEKGKGSTFTVTLELKEAQPAEHVDDATNEVGRELSILHCHVLIVEDNKVNQLLAGKLLDAIGFTHATVENGKECLTYLNSNAVDLVLMDCHMPVMDGFDTTRALRNAGFKEPIIALTANAQDSDRRACIAAGMNDFLSKPFKRQDFEAILYANLKTRL